MTDENDAVFVRVLAPELHALREPQFLIKVGSKYYATLAVLEYDLHAPNPSRDQREGLRLIERLFNDEANQETTDGAVVLRNHAALTGGQTKPPPHASGTVVAPPPPPGEPD